MKPVFPRQIRASRLRCVYQINPLNAELNPICHLLELLGADHILYVSRIRINIGFHFLNDTTPRIFVYSFIYCNMFRRTITAVLPAALWPWGWQPLTEMSTGNISQGVNVAGARGWQPYHLHVLNVFKSGSLNLLNPSGAAQACTAPHWYWLREQKDKLHTKEPVILPPQGLSRHQPTTQRHPPVQISASRY
jgi:hypothetical protein